MNQSNSPEAVTQRVVARIEQSIFQLNSGQPFDWNQLEYWEWRLIEIYRIAEAEFDNKFKIHTRLIFEAMQRQTR